MSTDQPNVVDTTAGPLEELTLEEFVDGIYKREIRTGNGHTEFAQLSSYSSDYEVNFDQQFSRVTKKLHPVDLRSDVIDSIIRDPQVVRVSASKSESLSSVLERTSLILLDNFGTPTFYVKLFSGMFVGRLTSEVMEYMYHVDPKTLVLTGTLALYRPKNVAYVSFLGD